MSDENLTDYVPGDFPIPVGVIVEFRGADYEVMAHHPVPVYLPSPEVNYPDGVAYVLHRRDMPRRFGGPGWVTKVRRRSLRVKGASYDD